MPFPINPIAHRTIFLKQLKKLFRISLHLTVKFNYIVSLFFYAIDTFEQAITILEIWWLNMPSA